MADSALVDVDTSLPHISCPGLDPVTCAAAPRAALALPLLSLSLSPRSVWRQCSTHTSFPSLPFCQGSLHGSSCSTQPWLSG